MFTFIITVIDSSTVITHYSLKYKKQDTKLTGRKTMKQQRISGD